MSENKSETSPLIWHLAMLASKDYTYPKVGDLVVENTHLIGFARKKVGLMNAFGRLKKIEDMGGMMAGLKKYTIECMDGKEQTWENANFCVVEKANG